MASRPTALETLDCHFLDTRHRILDVAAALDRIDRSDQPGAVNADPRLQQLRAAIGLLTDGKPDRAQRVQMVFSDPYDPNWRNA